MVLMDIIGDLLPPGVVNVVNGFGVEAASRSRRASASPSCPSRARPHGRLIMQYAAENLIPVTLELGGKSPNIFFADVADEDDDFFDKALEGFTMFALNQGEVCTCPSRALVHEKIYDRFMERPSRVSARSSQGNPLHDSTMIGAQASNDQLQKILAYIDIGKQENAKVLIGGGQAKLGGDLDKGFYVQPTVLEGHNKMRIFQEEIFGPVLAVTRFKDDEALAIANDTLYGLGAGVWTRNGTRAYRFGRALKAGRVWTNCYHLYPAHAAFGGYKQSGFGRENHKMMLEHYQQTKTFWQLQPQTSRIFLTGGGGCTGAASLPGGRCAMVERVLITEEAAKVLRALQEAHGDLLFHQSGGCCDGSAPMCYPAGEFRVGGRDVLWAASKGCPFYIGADQFEHWEHTQLIIDVVPGRGAGTRSRHRWGCAFTRSRVHRRGAIRAASVGCRARLVTRLCRSRLRRADCRKRLQAGAGRSGQPGQKRVR